MAGRNLSIEGCEQFLSIVIRRIALIFLFSVFSISLFASITLAGSETRPIEKSRQGTLPSSLPFSSTARYKTMPITPAATVEQALTYSDAEKTILEDVYDGDDQINTSAFYVLLRRAAMLPEGRDVLDQAEQPNPKSFWQEPRRYRGRLVRLEAIYAGRVTNYTKNLSPNRWWGKRPVWMMDVVEYQTNKPVIVALTKKPPGIAIGARIKISGIFYKVVTLPENKQTGDPSQKHDYPIIVAKSIFLFRRSISGGAPFGAVILSMSVILLVVLFIMLRRYITHRADAIKSRLFPEITPSSPEEDEVDEELRREVESYLAEKHDTERPED